MPVRATTSILGAGTTWYDADYYAFSPLSGVTIGDINPGAMDTVTITLTVGGVASDANGKLLGTNLTKAGAGTYTLAAATPQTLTAELDALVFTPKDGQVPLGHSVTTGVTIAVTDNGLTTTDSTTLINVTAENPGPSVYGLNGMDGVAGRVGGRGGSGQSVTATAYSLASPAYVSPAEGIYTYADGGNGGAGANAASLQAGPGSGGAGGGATVTATLVSDLPDENYIFAVAYGGQGGAGGQNSFAAQGGNGGNGGAATATAFANGTYGDSGEFIDVAVGSFGGTGGTAFGSGATGGAGGAASGTKATAACDNSDLVFVSQSGGNGGAGAAGANGGSGAASTLVNAVSILSAGGGALLSQFALGGAGGNSDTGHGGNGGFAISNFTADYTANAAVTGEIDAFVTGYGGQGGDGAIGGNGGATWDAATVTGRSFVYADTTAAGGYAGANGQAGGDGQAKATAIGSSATAEARAFGGLGRTIAGIANATATATGASGFAVANTSTGLYDGNLITGVEGFAVADVDGTNTALSQAGIATTMPSNPGGAIAYIDALPVAAYAARAEAGAPRTIAAMGATPNIVAMGELGGAHSTLGTDTQTSTTSIGLTMDLLQLTSTPDLFLGFYSVGATGSSGVTDINLTVSANSVTLLSEDFSSVAAAKSWFDGHPIDLGSLGSGPLAAETSLNLQVGMSVTTDHAGSGFSSYLVLGHG